MPENRVSSLLAWAQAEGKATGIVTTDRFKRQCSLNKIYLTVNMLSLDLIDSLTGASPAGTYAHSADRDWENDEVIFFFNLFKLTFVGYEDIASQLVSGQTSQRLFSQFSPNFVNFFLTFFFQLTPAGCEDIASQLVNGQTGRQ